MSLTFNVVDVETANFDSESICQIGVTHVVDGKIADQWETLVNPEDHFDAFNVRIHRIQESDVRDAPKLPEIRGELRRRLRDSILISHGSFDKTAFKRAMEKYNLEQLQVQWLDSMRIVRRAWPEKYAKSGYNLKNVAADLGIEFRHHNALEDSRATAKIVLEACSSTSTDIDHWLNILSKPVPRLRLDVSERAEVNAEGHLYGSTVVFTGALTAPRKDYENLARSVGLKTVASVSKKINILVVGIQDKQKTKGYDKSSKHRKAETLIDQGHDIKIVSENDFMFMVNNI